MKKPIIVAFALMQLFACTKETAVESTTKGNEVKVTVDRSKSPESNTRIVNQSTDANGVTSVEIAVDPLLSQNQQNGDVNDRGTCTIYEAVRFRTTASMSGALVGGTGVDVKFQLIALNLSTGMVSYPTSPVTFSGVASGLNLGWSGITDNTTYRYTVAYEYCRRTSGAATPTFRVFDAFGDNGALLDSDPENNSASGGTCDAWNTAVCPFTNTLPVLTAGVVYCKFAFPASCTLLKY